MEAKFSAPVQTGPGAHPTPCTMGTGSFPGVKSGRDVKLTPRSPLVPWSRKSRAIPLLPLWAVRPVQSLSACTRVHLYLIFTLSNRCSCRCQWPHDLRRRSAAARLLRCWVRIPPEAWMFVCCECCVLSGRGLCDELITRPEESYRLCCVVVFDLETSRMGAPYIYMTLVA